MNIKIPMSLPDIDESDVQAVASVVRSGHLSIGPKIEAFESAFSKYIGVEHSIGVSSGTCALHLILHAMDISEGDEVLVPSFTFAASANSILFTKARPVFVDIDPETLNIDPEDIKRKVSNKTRAVMVVDVFGNAAPWDNILSTCRDYNLLTIDDSCEALGARYKDRMIGSQADASTFAFYANKQITTAEGGMVTTNNGDLADVIRSLRNQGRSKMGAWLDHERMGFNYRMSELHAALGLSQLNRIESILSKRAEVANLYIDRLRGIPEISIPKETPDSKRSWFVFVVLLKDESTRAKVTEHLQSEGIPSRVYFPPVHKLGYMNNSSILPVTEAVSKRTLALPFSSVMTKEQVEGVVESLKRALA